MNDPWEKYTLEYMLLAMTPSKSGKNPAQKMKFSIRIYSVNVTKSTENCGFGQFTEEIPNGKLQFLYRASGQTHNSDFFVMRDLIQ